MYYPIAFLMMLICCLQTAFAAVPVILTGPVPAVASNYTLGTSTTLTYTITNNVPGNSFPLSISGISTPLSRVTVNNDCGNVIPPGPSTCNIGINISPTTAGNINQVLEVYYAGRRPLTSRLAFTVPSQTIHNGVMMSVGQTAADPADQPLVFASSDGGSTWHLSYEPLVGGRFESGSCTGSDPEVLCIAGGVDFASGAFIAVSSNSDTTWSTATLPTLTNTSIIFGTSCTGSGVNAVCAAVGHDAAGVPLILVSTDQGQTWASKSFFPVPPGLTAELNAVSCVGEGITANCVAVGTQSAPSAGGILLVSIDGGQTWGLNGNIDTTASFRSVNCSLNNGDTFCAVVGDTSAGAPFIALNMPNPITGNWSSPPINGLAASLGTLGTISCIGSNGTGVICAAGGRYNTVGNQTPLLVASDVGGTTWTAKTVTGLPAGNGSFYAASCTEMDTDTVCAVGGGINNAAPLLAMTINGGQNWSSQTVTGGPAAGWYLATYCTGVGPTAICTASGAEFTGGGNRESLLAVNLNTVSGSWSRVTSPGYQFNGAGGAGVTPNLQLH